MHFWRWIASQILGLVALCTVFISFQQKTKVRTLLFSSIGQLLGIIAMSLLLNWVLAGIFAISLIRNLTFILLDKKAKRISDTVSISVLCFFLICTTLIVFFTREWWFDWLLLVASLFSTYGKWAKGIHLIRISAVCFAMLSIVNHIIFSNLMAILIEATLLTSIAVFYVRYFTNKNKST